MSFFTSFWKYITKQPHLDQQNKTECSTYSIATAMGKSDAWAQELYSYSDKIPQKALRHLVEIDEISGFTQGKSAEFAIDALSRRHPVVLVCPWPTKVDVHGVLDVSKTEGGHAICVDSYDYDKGRFVLRGSSGDSWGDHGDVYLAYEDFEFLTKKFIPENLRGNVLEILE